MYIFIQESSSQLIDIWFSEIEYHLDDVKVKYLVGNKIDKKQSRVISFKGAKVRKTIIKRFFLRIY